MFIAWKRQYKWLLIMGINNLIKRAFKYRYVKFIITVEELLASYDDQLFY